MVIKSYSKNFEDVMLWRALKNLEKGFYIDVGAAWPISDSTTYLFYTKGWNGINIEPNHIHYSSLKELRLRDINLNFALSDQPGVGDYYEFSDTGLSTLDRDIAETHRMNGYDYIVREQSISTLNEVWAEYVPNGQDVHFLKIDAEGYENQILQGNDWNKNRPWTVVVEAVHPNLREPNYFLGEGILLSANYHFAYFDGVNRIYVADEKKDLLESFTGHPDIRNEFATGSEISIEEKLNDITCERDQAIAQNNQAVIERDQAISDRDQAIAYRDALLNSTSWRITSIIRFMGFHLKDCHNKFIPILNSLVYRLYCLVKTYPRILSFIKLAISHFPWFKNWIISCLYNRQFLKTYSYTPLYKSSDSIVLDDGIPFQNRFVLLYVELVSNQQYPTGITRVSSKIAENFTNRNEIVILVKLDPVSLNLIPLSVEEMQNFRKFSKFKITDKSKAFYDPGIFKKTLERLHRSPVCSWLIIPEPTYHSYHSVPPTSRLIKCARDLGINVGAVFHDNIPLLHESAKENNLKHARYLSDLSIIDVIWPVSQYASESLRHYYEEVEKLSEQQMPVISPNSHADEGPNLRCLPQSNENPQSILCIGSLCFRKNQVTLISAFNAYCESHPSTSWRLILVGHYVEDEYKKLIKKEIGKNKKITVYDSLNDCDLQALYESVSFTVFPSTEEGYGLPIVESLWNLRPCICANHGSMAEIAKTGGCVTIDVTSVEEMTKVITCMIEDDSTYQSKLREIIKRPVKSWSEYTDKFFKDMETYDFGRSFSGHIYIWVDATIQTSGNSGIQRVTRQICRTLLSQGHCLTPIKWDDINGIIALPSEIELEYLEKWNGPDRSKWCMQLASSEVEGPQVYFLPELPLNRSLYVQQKVIDYFKDLSAYCCCIFYDAIPYKMRDIYPPDFVSAMQEYLAMLDQMDNIYCISNFTQHDLYSYLNNYAPIGKALELRVKAVSLAEDFPNIERPRLLPKRNLKSCQILSVGTVEPRKNHKTLIEAFLTAEKRSFRPLSLTLVGGNNSFDPNLESQIEELITKSKNITWIKNVDDSHLTALYQKADFTVYQSLEEGFGLPIVESLWFMTPCICSDSGQMAELALHGGCYTANVRNVQILSDAIVDLANDEALYEKLIDQIQHRYFKTWERYAREISNQLYNLTHNKKPIYPEIVVEHSFPFMPRRPVLSVCITTYNRKKWLDININNFIDISKGLEDKVELVICDNASAYAMDDFVMTYAKQPNISFYRNSGNIGMLGNLAQTVSLANGEYIWLVGDDDIIHPGALERILDDISNNSPEIIILNYNVSNDPVPDDYIHVASYLKRGFNVSLDSISQTGPAKLLSTFNENFFTAIYSFIVKRSYAYRIFNQDTSGEAFSSLQTCVPSSKYILSHMMDTDASWIASPYLTINLNVSWGKYAPIWLLERIPEVYDLAVFCGVPEDRVDLWRTHTFEKSRNLLKMVFENPQSPFWDQFDVMRFIRRNRSILEFEHTFAYLLSLYKKAQTEGHLLTVYSIDDLKNAYNRGIN